MATNILPSIPQTVGNVSKGQFVGQKLRQSNKSLTQTDSSHLAKFKVRRASKDTSSSITEHKPRHTYIDPARLFIVNDKL